MYRAWDGFPDRVLFSFCSSGEKSNITLEGCGWFAHDVNILMSWTGCTGVFLFSRSLWTRVSSNKRSDVSSVKLRSPISVRLGGTLDLITHKTCQSSTCCFHVCLCLCFQLV